MGGLRCFVRYERTNRWRQAHTTVGTVVCTVAQAVSYDLVGYIQQRLAID